MSDKTLKDLKYEAHIAVLNTKVESLIEKQKELTHRVRANEKVVAAIGLLGSIALAFIGAGYFAAPADAQEFPNELIGRQEPYPGMLPDTAASANQMISRFRQWEAEQRRTDPEFDINSALAEYFNNGGTDTTEQEELLQLQSSESGQCIGWRYDRRDDRSWFRPLQNGTSESGGSGYSGEED